MADPRSLRVYAPFDPDLDLDDPGPLDPPPPAPDPRPGPRADLVVSFLGVACDAARKARHFAHTDEVARLTDEVHARLVEAVGVAQRNLPRRSPRSFRDRRSA